MNKLTIRILIIFAIFVLVLIPALGKDYKVQIPKETTLDGVKLIPGKYKLKLEENSTASIEKDGIVVVTTRVEIGDLEQKLNGSRHNPHIVLLEVLFGKEGELTEMRLKGTKVRFLGPLQMAQVNP